MNLKLAKRGLKNPENWAVVLNKKFIWKRH